ncbi:MAG: ribonuclease HII [Patescibacteria group bacterium]|nr:ribonuclease HII [Patescibacteria group bacterium]
MHQFLIGVDEAGRAPLAGPVSVGFVRVPLNFDVLKEFPGTKDSKQLTASAREEIYEQLLGRKKTGDIEFVVRFSDHLTIDELGITKAVKKAIISGVRALAPEPAVVSIKLDGLLYAPSQYVQETIINGDESQPIISLASIAAKVERDRLMKRMAKKFPNYGFESHKGYGTKMHYDAIRQFGLSEIHRRSYCKWYESAI